MQYLSESGSTIDMMISSTIHVLPNNTILFYSLKIVHSICIAYTFFKSFYAVIDT